jgi:hypothetical protein
MEITENKPFFEKWRKKLIAFVENQAKEVRIQNLENKVADLEKKLMSKEKFSLD